jgi:ribosomal protein S18 acetylase RimI-like enzyme
MNVHYRQANLEDTNELNFLAEIDITIPPLYDPDFLVNEKTLLQHISLLKEKFKRDDFFEVATTPNGQIIGFHFVRKSAHFDGFAGSVFSLWVDPEFRKQGIGTKLKTHAESWAREHKLDHLYTFVHVDNKAMLALNHEMGFEHTHVKLKKKL